jgi:hypothetical protein
LRVVVDTSSRIRSKLNHCTRLSAHLFFSTHQLSLHCTFTSDLKISCKALEKPSEELMEKKGKYQSFTYNKLNYSSTDSKDFPAGTSFMIFDALSCSNHRGFHALVHSQKTSFLASAKGLFSHWYIKTHHSDLHIAKSTSSCVVLEC